MNTTTPCKIRGAASYTGWKGGFIYVIDSVSQFVPNDGTKQDGLIEYPTITKGSSKLTNRGVFVVSTQKDAQQFN